MPLVSVWKCPRTGKLFERKRAYIKYLRSIASQNLESKKRRRRYKVIVDSEAAMRERVNTPQEIVQWYYHNWDELVYQCWERELNACYKDHIFDLKRAPKILQMKLQLSRTSDISGFWQKKDPNHVPKPGFSGTVEVEMFCPKGSYSLGSEIFDITRSIVTGGGNGGSAMRYSCTVSDDLWPGLVIGWNRAQAFKKVAIPFTSPEFI